MVSVSRLIVFQCISGNISGGPKERGLAFEFQNLVKNVWYGNTQTIQPKDFKMVLGNIYSQFKDCRQVDTLLIIM
jgi:ubiquitin C-terminal hydrolase